MIAEAGPLAEDGRREKPRKHMMFALFCGPAFGILFFAGYIIAGFFPPLAASLNAEQISSYYRAHQIQILAGQSLPLLFSCLLAPWHCLIAYQLKKIDGCSPVLVYSVLVLSGVMVVFFMLPSLFWLIAAYRPERDPDITFMLNDMASLFLIPPIGPFALQPFIIGIAILSDRALVPRFPRWVAYVNFWVGTLFLVDCIAVFFKSGPFSWNGLFAFWMAAVAFGVWMTVMFLQLWRVLHAHAEGDASDERRAAAKG